jgi:hypothetical protein
LKLQYKFTACWREGDNLTVSADVLQDGKKVANRRFKHPLNSTPEALVSAIGADVKVDHGDAGLLDVVQSWIDAGDEAIIDVADDSAQQTAAK